MYDGIFRLRRRGPADSGFLIRSPAGRLCPLRLGKGPTPEFRTRTSYKGDGNAFRPLFSFIGRERRVRVRGGDVVGRCRSCGGRDISESGMPSVSGPWSGHGRKNPSGRASISFFVLKKSALSDCLRSFSSDILGIFVSKNRLRRRGPGYCPTVAVLFVEYTWVYLSQRTGFATADRACARHPLFFFVEYIWIYLSQRTGFAAADRACARHPLFFSPNILNIFVA